MQWFVQYEGLTCQKPFCSLFVSVRYGTVVALVVRALTTDELNILAHIVEFTCHDSGLFTSIRNSYLRL